VTRTLQLSRRRNRARFSWNQIQGYQAIEKVAIRKLFQLHAARALHDLRAPGNSLEALKGDRAGQHSIRINDRYRLCFIWKDGGAHQVEITDYH
jgi:proteic killer suppression protein